MTEINIDDVVENCKKYRMRMLELEMRIKTISVLFNNLLAARLANSPVDAVKLEAEILELLEVSE